MPFAVLTGAHGDVKELEYIAALHQTCMPHTRANATVSSTDVRALLASRYGVQFSEAECAALVRGLGGPLQHQSTEDDDEEGLPVYFDLVQILSLLLIPVLVRSKENLVVPTAASTDDVDAQENSDPPNEECETTSKEQDKTGNDVADKTDPASPPVTTNGADSEKQEEAQTSSDECRDSKLTDDKEEEAFCVSDAQMQTDHKHDSSTQQDTQDTKKDDLEVMESSKDLSDLFAALVDMIGSDNKLKRGDSLDIDTMRRILLHCGETEYASDDALVHEMLSLVDNRLDEDTFASAVTADLMGAWDTKAEDRLSTRYFDVFMEERDKAVGRKEEPKGDGPKVLHQGNISDHADVDFVVDSHTSVVCVVLIWCYFFSLVVSYIPFITDKVSYGCKEDRSPLLCKFAVQISFW